MSWVGEALGAIGTILVGLLKSRPRIKVGIYGPIGLEPPNPYDFTITVRNMSTDPITIIEAGVIIVSSEGKWWLAGEPVEKPRLKGRDSGRWGVRAERVRRHIVGKGVYEARLMGYARPATGGEARSRDMPISYPNVLGR